MTRRWSWLPLAAVMLALTALAAGAVNSNNWPMRPMITNKTMSFWKGDTTCFVYSVGVPVGSTETGMIAVRVTADSSGDTYAADSVRVDSVACEVFLYTIAGIDSTGLTFRSGCTTCASPVIGDSTRYALFDLDDSKGNLGRWFCTTQPDTSLAFPGSLTPTTSGAAKFPGDVGTRLIFARPKLTTYDLTAIPGMSLVKNHGHIPGAQGWAGNNQAPSAWFFLPLTDAYGGPLRGLHNIKIGVLNRQPRIAYKVSAWYLGASQ